MQITSIQNRNNINFSAYHSNKDRFTERRDHALYQLSELDEDTFVKKYTETREKEDRISDAMMLTRFIGLNHRAEGKKIFGSIMSAITNCTNTAYIENFEEAATKKVNEEIIGLKEDIDVHRTAMLIAEGKLERRTKHKDEYIEENKYQMLNNELNKVDRGLRTLRFNERLKGFADERGLNIDDI